ncbi:MAG: FAD-dependent oxidoreductase [Bradymonadaceae bacterium]
MLSIDDVAVIGAGPVGSVAAWAFAEKGADVHLLEANPQAAQRFAGEWLHPPGVEVLEELGLLPIEAAEEHHAGEGFAVFPADGSDSIALPYAEDRYALSCDHELLVSELRERATEHAKVDYRAFARATEVEQGAVHYRNTQTGEEKTVRADLIVGAEGKSSVARRAVGADVEPEIVSYMGALTLEEFELSHPGYGHVLLGGPGPMLLYRVGPDRVRVSIDVPVDRSELRRDVGSLYEAFAPAMPDRIAAAVREALERQSPQWAAAHFRPHVSYGSGRVALVGDAVGTYHPMTAVGMTSGFEDVRSLVRTGRVSTYEDERARESYVPELLSSALYKVFRGRDEGAATIRRAVYRTWRTSPGLCRRTMRLLSGSETDPRVFATTFSLVAGRAVLGSARRAVGDREIGALAHILGVFGPWVRWPLVPLLPEAIKQRLRQTATIDTPFELKGTGDRK